MCLTFLLKKNKILCVCGSNTLAQTSLTDRHSWIRWGSEINTKWLYAWIILGFRWRIYYRYCLLIICSDSDIWVVRFHWSESWESQKDMFIVLARRSTLMWHDFECVFFILAVVLCVSNRFVCISVLLAAKPGENHTTKPITCNIRWTLFDL